MSREDSRTAAELPRVGTGVEDSAPSTEARGGLWSSNPPALQPREARAWAPGSGDLQPVRDPPVAYPATRIGRIGVVGMKMNEVKETAPNLRIFAFLCSFNL